MNLELKKFDISQIKDDKVVVLIGKRDTGKSFLCKDILYHHRDIPVGQVISGTEAANQFYGELVPPLFIHEEFDTEIVSNIKDLPNDIKNVEDLIEEGKEIYDDVKDISENIQEIVENKDEIIEKIEKVKDVVDDVKEVAENIIEPLKEGDINTLSENVLKSIETYIPANINDEDLGEKIEDHVENILEEHLDDIPIEETVSSSFNCFKGLLALFRR